ncbi:MAG: hypothetical protein Alpg2KO_05470 [Alphaproteobacteria bacterium]
MDNLQPLFIHALWRSSSTWMAMLYRDHPACRLYYEPLHETLVTAQGAVLEGRFGTGQRYADLRHPKVSKHYFAEYPFVDGGKVRGFQPRFSLNRFHLQPSDTDTELAAWFEHLIQHAQADGLKPVLQPNRGWLRMAWMKQNLGGVHIWLERGLEGVFRSSWSFKGKRSFMTYYVAIAGLNQDDPLIGPIARRHDIPALTPSVPDQELKDAAAYLENLTKSEALALVADFHELALAQARSCCDLILTHDALNSTASRHQMEDNLHSLTGIRPDFSSWRTS